MMRCRDMTLRADAGIVGQLHFYAEKAYRLPATRFHG